MNTIMGFEFDKDISDKFRYDDYALRALVNLQQYNVAILDKVLYQQCALNCYEILSEH